MKDESGKMMKKAGGGRREAEEKIKVKSKKAKEGIVTGVLHQASFSHSRNVEMTDLKQTDKADLSLAGLRRSHEQPTKDEG